MGNTLPARPLYPQCLKCLGQRTLSGWALATQGHESTDMAWQGRGSCYRLPEQVSIPTDWLTHRGLQPLQAERGRCATQSLSRALSQTHRYTVCAISKVTTT